MPRWTGVLCTCMRIDAIWFHVAGSHIAPVRAEQWIQWSLMQSDVKWHSARSQHQPVKREDIQTAVKCMGEGWDGRGEWHNAMELWAEMRQCTERVVSLYVLVAPLRCQTCFNHACCPQLASVLIFVENVLIFFKYKRFTLSALTKNNG